MLTRQQVFTQLLALGFTSESPTQALIGVGMEVAILDAPRIAVTSTKGITYIAVSSGTQLEEQLTNLLGYQLPPGRSGLIEGFTTPRAR